MRFFAIHAVHFQSLILLEFLQRFTRFLVKIAIRAVLRQCIAQLHEPLLHHLDIVAFHAFFKHPDHRFACILACRIPFIGNRTILSCQQFFHSGDILLRRFVSGIHFSLIPQQRLLIILLYTLTILIAISQVTHCNGISRFCPQVNQF